MQNFVFIACRGPIIAASLVLLFASAAHAGEIYKWVDKDGKTHYSSRKEDAGAAETRTIRPDPAQPTASGARPAAQANYEDFIRGKTPTQAGDPKSPRPVAQKPAARNYASEADADKCQLARDILSGYAKRSNGAPVDANDRQVAESDVRIFCK